MRTHVHQNIGSFWNTAEMKLHVNMTCFHAGLKSQTGYEFISSLMWTYSWIHKVLDEISFREISNSSHIIRFIVKAAIQRCSAKKFYRKTHVPGFLFNKVAGGAGVFLWIFWNFYKHLFSQNTSLAQFSFARATLVMFRIAVIENLYSELFRKIHRFPLI